MPLPERTNNPGGRPVALHVKGAVPPQHGEIANWKRSPRTASSTSPTLILSSVSGTPRTSIDIDFVYDRLLPSVAVTWKKSGPVPAFAAIVPEIVPEGLSDNPDGRPPSSVHVNEPVPPEAARD